MARYPLGQPVRVPLTVRDPGGALSNATTLSLVVKIAAADGSMTTTGTYTSPTNDGTGLYHQDVPAADLTAAGHYQWALTTTVPANVTFGDFDVFDPYETAVLPLADAKDELNIPQATITYDSELHAYIATYESSLERMTGGPATNRSVTERAEFDPSLTSVIVRQRPLVSVTSITDIVTGTVVSLTSPGLDTDPNSCIIQQKDGSPFTGLTSPAATIVYVAGWGTKVPAAFNLAGRMIVQHLWETQHGPAQRPSMGGMELTTIPGFAFAIPNRAAELLAGNQDGLTFRQEAVFA